MSYIAKNGRLYTSGASEALTLLDDKFSVNKSYSKGDSCIYNDYLWKFTSDKPAGEWDNTVVEQCRIMDFVDDANGRLTQVQTQIVPTASIEIGETASKAYNVGDFLVKNGVLYKVTNAIVKDDVLTVGINIDSTTVVDELNSSDTFIKKMKLLGRSSNSTVVKLNESFKEYDAIYVSVFIKTTSVGQRVSTSIFAFSEDINAGDKIMLLGESDGNNFNRLYLTISSETSFTTSIFYNTTVIGINL